MTQGLITSAQNERLDGAGKITRCEKVKQTRIQRADNARAEKTASGPDAFDTRDSQSCSSVSRLSNLQAHQQLRPTKEALL